MNREVAGLCMTQTSAPVPIPKSKDSSNIRTALAIPSVGPGLGAERSEGVVELQDTHQYQHRSKSPSLAGRQVGATGIPGGRGGNPRPWQWCTYSSRRSSASSAWSWRRVSNGRAASRIRAGKGRILVHLRETGVIACGWSDDVSFADISPPARH